MLAPALLLPAAPHAKKDQPAEPTAKPEQRATDWDASRLYGNTWSANELLDTPVRGSGGAEQIGEVHDIIVHTDGTIDRVVVEVGGFLEIGDQHIGVPWSDVRIGPELAHVQVPLREVESGTYSLFGRVPQGEEVRAANSAWRVQELIGDYAALKDVPRYGIVRDVIFSDRGRVQGVVVDRTAGVWGAPGYYAYPYYGYPGTYAYGLPYMAADARDFVPFDYAQLAQQSRYASEDNPLAQAQARQNATRQNAAERSGQQARDQQSAGGAAAQQSQSAPSAEGATPSGSSGDAPSSTAAPVSR